MLSYNTNSTLTNRSINQSINPSNPNKYLPHHGPLSKKPWRKAPIDPQTQPYFYKTQLNHALCAPKPLFSPSVLGSWPPFPLPDCVGPALPPPLCRPPELWAASGRSAVRWTRPMSASFFALSQYDVCYRWGVGKMGGETYGWAGAVDLVRAVFDGVVAWGDVVVVFGAADHCGWFRRLFVLRWWGWNVGGWCAGRGGCVSVGSWCGFLTCGWLKTHC